MYSIKRCHAKGGCSFYRRPKKEEINLQPHNIPLQESHIVTRPQHVGNFSLQLHFSRIATYESSDFVSHQLSIALHDPIESNMRFSVVFFGLSVMKKGPANNAGRFESCDGGRTSTDKDQAVVLYWLNCASDVHVKATPDYPSNLHIDYDLSRQPYCVYLCQSSILTMLGQSCIHLDYAVKAESSVEAAS
jgi:hypothetical protein